MFRPSTIPRQLYSGQLLLGATLLLACGSPRPPHPVLSARPAEPAGAKQLLSHLPARGELPVGPDGLWPRLQEVYALLSVEPPAQPELRVSDESPDVPMRRKIEAYFETDLRWQDDLRLRAVELIGGLMEGISTGADPVLSHVLSGLVLEDLAALGFDASGNYFSASFDVAPERMAEAMARPEVIYSGLAAQAYTHCQAAAALANAPQWAAFCAESKHAMLVFAQALPACTAPSISLSSGLYEIPAAPRPSQAGLLLHGASGVPLLGDELDRLVASVHEYLQANIDLPLLPFDKGTAVPAAGAGCSHPRRPSEALIANHPDTRWYGMFLRCLPGGCDVGVCSEGEEGCFHAVLDGSPTDLSAWQAAVANLKRTDGGLLVNASGMIVSQHPSVTVDALELFGAWRDADAARRAVNDFSRQLLVCQATDRYQGRWVLDIDRDGRVAATRAESDRFAYPMDQVLDEEAPQRRCIERRLSELQLPPRRTRKRRRMTFEMRIPARLQVELPFVVRHDSDVGQLEDPDRLGRDGFAVAVAECASQVHPRVQAIGVCMELTPDGRIRQLSFDPDPGQRSRALERLTHAKTRVQPTVVADVSACLTNALSAYDWTCRDPDAGVGHLALTLELPSGLLARFQ